MGVFSSQPSLEAAGAASLRESPWGAAGVRGAWEMCASAPIGPVTGDVNYPTLPANTHA